MQSLSNSGNNIHKHNPTILLMMAVLIVSNNNDVRLGFRSGAQELKSTLPNLTWTGGLCGLLSLYTGGSFGVGSHFEVGTKLGFELRSSVFVRELGLAVLKSVAAATFSPTTTHLHPCPQRALLLLSRLMSPYVCALALYHTAP